MRTMSNANVREYTLFCPVCRANFIQLVVLHKLPKDFNVDSILADAVARHDHKAYQDAMEQKNEADTAQQKHEKAE